MIHFVVSTITSLFAFSSNILTYWQLTNQTINYQAEIDSRWRIAILRGSRRLNEVPIFISEDQNILITCSATPSSSVSDLTNYMLALSESYVGNRLIPFFYSQISEYSCAVLDGKSSTLHLISDAAGSIPIWYYTDVFISNEQLQVPVFLATTDTVLPLEYGLQALHTVPANHWITVNLGTNAITNVLALNLQNVWTPLTPTNLPEISRFLLEKVIEGLSRSISTVSNKDVLIEVDDQSAMSKILDCAADHLKISRKIRKTRKIRQPSPLPLPESITDLIRRKLESDYSGPGNTKLFERWKFCSFGDSTVFVSFYGADSMPREVEIGFQNFLCSCTNTTILYPLRDSVIELFLRQFADRSRAIHEAWDFLFASSNLCPNYLTEFLSPTDESCNEQGYCFDYLVTYMGGHRLISQPNKGDQSSLTHSHPEDKQDPKISELLANAKRFTSSEGFLITITYSSSHHSLELLSNFLCHFEVTFSDRTNLPLLIFTDDHELLSKLDFKQFMIVPSRYACSFTRLQDIVEKLFEEDFLDFCRMHIILSLLETGLHPIFTDIDTIWFANPFSWLNLISIETKFIPDSPKILSKSTSLSSSLTSLRGKNGNVFYSKSELARMKKGSLDLILNNDEEEAIFLAFGDSALRENHSIHRTNSQDTRSVASFIAKKTIDSYDIAFLQQELITNLHLLVFRSSDKTIAWMKDFLLTLYEVMTSYLHAASDLNVSIDRINFRFLLQNTVDFFLVEGQGGQSRWSHLHRRKLPEKFFPNAFSYFFERKEGVDSTAMVLVNDLLISYDHEAKFHRLLANGLWTFFPPVDKPVFDSNYSRPFGHFSCSFCLARHHSSLPHSSQYDRRWQNAFEALSPITSKSPILSFEILRPFHNEVVFPLKNKNFSNAKTVMTSFLGDFESKKDRPIPSVLIDSFLNSQGLFGFQRITFFDLNALHANSSLMSLSFLIPTTRLQNHVDTFLLPDNNLKDSQLEDSHMRAQWAAGFGVDALGVDLRVGNENLVSLSTSDEFDFPFSEDLRNLIEEQDLTVDLDGTRLKEPMEISYTLKVLAFNRTESLLRLLTSLERADYSGQSNISLEIFIDRYRMKDDKIGHFHLRQVAEEFRWSHGPKRIIVREEHIGLANQWYRAWSPQHLNELAFIFEDDIEVSPYFFRWTSAAVDRYYRKNPTLQRLHLLILKTVRERIRSYTPSPLMDVNNFATFVEKYVGYPLIYGICAQKQPLDSLRHPSTLRIRNGHRPFLFSPIGTWGPLLFPAIWQAFREWWRWKAQFLVSRDIPLRSADLVQNLFLEHNPRIWSPYFTRFAYEFGAKCLYSNLPGNISLVNNYREAGENYGSPQGSYARLLDGEMLQMMVADSRGAESSIASFEEKHLIDLKELRSSLEYFPTLKELAHWQFDFGQRRIGSLGSDNPFPLIASLRGNPRDALTLSGIDSNGSANIFIPSPLMARSYQRMDSLLRFARSFSNLHSDGELSGASVDGDRMTLLHWLELENLIEANLLPSSRILFVHPSPLLFFLQQRANHSHNYQLFLRFFHNSFGLCDPLRNDPQFLANLQAIDCRDLSMPRTSRLTITLLVLPLAPIHRSPSIPWAEEIDLTSLEYLLVIDSCVSAPDRLVFQSIEFHAIEKLCDTFFFEDHGAVLYR